MAKDSQAKLETSAPGHSPGRRIHLEIRGTERFPLDTDVIRIGRGTGNSIQINDPSVSGQHCEVIIGPDGPVIRDLGSTNGTFVAGERVQATSLAWGEPFWLGQVECVLRRDPSAEGECPTETAGRVVNKIDKEGWRALGLSLVLTIAVCVVPLFAYVIDFLRLIVHETGHTLTAWFFGYPTLPMLRPGGGVSASLERPSIMILVMIAIWARLLYRAYRGQRHRWVLTIGAAVYLIVAFSGLGRLMIVSMGHGAELAVASLFLYRAVSGQSILVRAERPLYATVAMVILGLDVRFLLALLSGEGEADYREGFDGNSHDLVRIADDYLGIGLQSVAFGYLLLCLAAPCAVLLYYRYGRRTIYS